LSGIGTGPRAEQLRVAGASVVLPDYSDIDAFITALENASSSVSIWAGAIILRRA
jgi:hypothetical protein